MKYFFLFIFVLLIDLFFAQNNIRIFSAKGELFTLIAFDTVQNKTPQTNILISSVYEDSLRIKIELENKTKIEATLFLFEKGKATKNKEFNYKATIDQNKIKVSYAGYYDIVKLPNPIVPEKPIIDTTAKYKNTLLGHFCELKDSKPVYFNNIPKAGICSAPMPAEYLNYLNLLMLKAQVPDDKFIIADNVCRNNCLSVDQLNFILKYIDYELEKLKIIKIVYPNITDKPKNKELEKSFHFESSIQELNNFFKVADTQKIKISSTCKIASSPEEIKNFENNLSVYTNDSQRFELFKKNYEQYCYSKDHIILILSKFIHDREKLDAAKMLYYVCVEKENFLLISHTFSYNETISELKDFVAKQKD
ncbi:MAG: DUF4476 domain-containing protein [Bacteroidetes bacterium]|nr:DUF4476 domain-containing protein [Bacteroidota bacterium]